GVSKRSSRSTRGGRLSRAIAGSLAVGERPTKEALRHAALVEVLRDAAEEERPPGAEQQARVDVLRRGDDALFEQTLDLVRDRLERGYPDLLRRAWAVIGDDDLSVAGREVGERQREGKTIGMRLVQRVQDVVGDARCDERQQ